jgi:hypothetical protein
MLACGSHPGALRAPGLLRLTALWLGGRYRRDEAIRGTPAAFRRSTRQARRDASALRAADAVSHRRATPTQCHAAPVTAARTSDAAAHTTDAAARYG